MNNVETLATAAVEQLVVAWYGKLDVHAPVAELLPMLSKQNLEMRFPEATLHGQNEFIQWYEGVTRKFFDEVHTLKEVHIQNSGKLAEVQLVVNWQARIWLPPAAKSQWLGFDAIQRWVVTSSEQTHYPVIATYIVDALNPMPGSVSL